MTDDAKRIVAQLRKHASDDGIYYCKSCDLHYDWICEDGCFYVNAANMIESLSAELEAAKRDLTEWGNCFTCKHAKTCNGDCGGERHYEWQGIKEGGLEG